MLFIYVAKCKSSLFKRMWNNSKDKLADFSLHFSASYSHRFSFYCKNCLTFFFSISFVHLFWCKQNRSLHCLTGFPFWNAQRALIIFFNVCNYIQLFECDSSLVHFECIRKRIMVFRLTENPTSSRIMYANWILI